jgi:hypothetical protein
MKYSGSPPTYHILFPRSAHPDISPFLHLYSSASHQSLTSPPLPNRFHPREVPWPLSHCTRVPWGCARTTPSGGRCRAWELPRWGLYGRCADRCRGLQRVGYLNRGEIEGTARTYMLATEWNTDHSTGYRVSNNINDCDQRQHPVYLFRDSSDDQGTCSRASPRPRRIPIFLFHIVQD